MSKPQLIDEDSKLEHELIQTFIAGHKEWRPDLPYPESHSDMQAGIRALLKMFKIERRPIAEPLKIKCGYCKGLREFTTEVEKHHFQTKKCDECKGKGYILSNY